MGVYLDRFSNARAPSQALGLREFVAEQPPDWLKEFHPGTATRNRDYLHATYNVARLAWLTRRHGERFSFVIQERTDAIRIIGTATIILNGAVFSPVEDWRVIDAPDIDYVARHDVPVETHREIGAALVSRTTELMGHRISSRSPEANIPPYRVLATINPADPHPSTGLIAIPGMEPLGEPQPLRVVGANDYHQLDKGGAELQLYVLPTYTF